jgi:hypothetical protein
LKFLGQIFTTQTLDSNIRQLIRPDAPMSGISN